VPLAMFSIYL